MLVNPAFSGGQLSLSHSCNRIRVDRTEHLCPEWSQALLNVWEGSLIKWDYVVRPSFSMPVLPTLISLTRSPDQFCHTSLETNTACSFLGFGLLLCCSGNVNPSATLVVSAFLCHSFPTLRESSRPRWHVVAKVFLVSVCSTNYAVARLS